MHLQSFNPSSILIFQLTSVDKSNETSFILEEIVNAGKSQSNLTETDENEKKKLLKYVEVRTSQYEHFGTFLKYRTKMLLFSTKE